MSDAQAGKKAPRRAKVFIVDDHPIMRDGLKKLINSEDDLTVCGESGDARKSLTKIESLKPDIVLVDLSLEGTSGMELIKNLHAVNPRIPMLVVTMHDESVYAERVLRSGAKGYIMKQEATEKLLTAIREVLEGGIYVSMDIQRKMMTNLINPRAIKHSSPIECLSGREWEVFQLLGKGKGTRQIAKELSLSVKTIETNRARIKEKLKLKDAMQLVRYAVQWVEGSRIR